MIYARRTSIWNKDYRFETNGMSSGSYRTSRWRDPTVVVLGDQRFEIRADWRTPGAIGWRSFLHTTVEEDGAALITIVRTNKLLANYADLEFTCADAKYRTPGVGSFGRSFSVHPVHRDAALVGEIRWAGFLKRDWEIDLMADVPPPAIALLFYHSVSTQ